MLRICVKYGAGFASGADMPFTKRKQQSGRFLLDKLSVLARTGELDKYSLQGQLWLRSIMPLEDRTQITGRQVNLCRANPPPRAPLRRCARLALANRSLASEWPDRLIGSRSQ